MFISLVWGLLAPNIVIVICIYVTRNCMTLGVFNYGFLPSQHSMVILVVGLAVLLAMPIYAGMYMI